MDDNEAQRVALEEALRAAGFRSCGCCDGIYVEGTLPDGTKIAAWDANVNTRADAE